MNGAGNGPDWGHWVSRDFVKWARLPVAIWNDQYYDNVAIYTGSATIVDGKPVIMYPGMCNGGDGPGGGPGCNDGHGGSTYVVVVPENASDPLYTKWSKSGSIGGKQLSNPVLNNTGDDPSTAWKTAAGEWRIIGNQGCPPEGGNPMYGSMDFVEWYKIGCTTLMAGDCPTFFPLPALTPGSESFVESHGALPTHVHKSGGPGGDQCQVGQWTDGQPGPQGKGTVGTWVQTPGSASVKLDKGKTHASKDFHDPIKNRRIMWVWGTVPSGIQTIPRQMTYHPGIKQIVYTPVDEMDQLHTTQLASLPASTLPVAKLPISSASDTELFFEKPAAATDITVSFGKSSVYINYVPSNDSDVYRVSVGASGGGTDDLPLLAQDEHVSMRIFVDGTVGEAYWQEGRVAMTFEIPAGTSLDNMAVTATGTVPVRLLNATSFAMSSIYTTSEAVLATPRLRV